MLFEATVSIYCQRHGKFDELIAFCKERRGNNKTTAKSDKQIMPSMDEMLAFLSNHPEVWGTGKASHLRHSLGKMSGYQQTLNSAVHNPYQPIQFTTVLQIRDEILPALRHLLETLGPPENT